MRKMVLSGINLYEGGPLAIYYDCLEAIKELGIYKRYHIIAFVHKKSLFKKYKDIINFIELPKSRKNYAYRLYYEYFFFKKYSNNHDIDIWISLHDITPNVKAKKLYTYCHNPSPFMEKEFSKVRYSLKNVAFSYFYKYLYRINISSASAVIVQQDWMREEFKKMYSIDNIIVARPDVKVDFVIKKMQNKKEKKIFVYPAFPRFFKNFELICEACKYLEKDNFEIWLTIDGSENQYSREIRKKYSGLKQIRWIGIQKREKIFEIYDIADCLIFPSKLETWGLPISEFKLTQKDILLVDLPYAHETLGEYEKVMFFRQNDPEQLAKCMKMEIEEKPIYSPQKKINISKPFYKGWKELLEKICDNE